jgi:UDP-2,3-diacylglucosamine hydrolase
VGSASLEKPNMSDRTGIIAGRGPLPLKIARSLVNQQHPPFLLLIKDEADPADYADYDFAIVGITKVGKILSLLKDGNCRNVVMAGPVNRPNFRNVIPDLEGLKLLKKLNSAKRLGDNSLLSIITSYIEEKGFRVFGAHEYDTDLTAGAVCLGTVMPDESEMNDITKAVQILKTIGQLDIGQALVYRDGHVLAVEAAEGTEQMLLRSEQFKRDVKAGFLVKMSKPGQNLSVDMPAIGLDTVNSVVTAGLKGIVFEGEKTLLLDQHELIASADKQGIFVFGVTSDDS